MSSFLSSLFGRGAKAGELQPDTATSLAAARALALAGSGPDWWPYVVLVTPATLAVHVAGAAAPAPAEPWRIGPDPRVWTVSRADAQSALEGGQALADLLEAATYPRPILLGRFTDGFVYLDMARAPGALAVRGAEPWAGRVRELLIAQLADATQVRDGGEGLSGAHWPVEVDEDGRISVLGVAMAVAIKSPERLDLPIAPTRQAVLREMTAAARQPAPPEDAAMQGNAAGRGNAAARGNAAGRTEIVAASAIGAADEAKAGLAPAALAKPGATPAAATAATSAATAAGAPAIPGSAAPTIPAPTIPTPATPTPATPTPATPTPATPASAPPASRVPAAPANPAPTSAASGRPGSARASQRHLPAELYDAPAISAAAPAPVPAPAPAKKAASAQQPVPAQHPVPAQKPGAAPPRRPQPIPPRPPAAPVVEWNDVAVSSAEED